MCPCIECTCTFKLLCFQLPHKLTYHFIAYRIAQKAHGYVGADLSAVCKEAGLLAMNRLLSNRPLGEALICKPENFALRIRDMEDAMLKVRPSAMRSINIDVPKVAWDDIGGQLEIKKRLKEAVEWPLRYPEVLYEFRSC